MSKKNQIYPFDVELLTHVSNGLTTAKIAKIMRHAEPTIETYRVKLMRRLQAKNTAHMMRIAFERKLLTA